MIRRLRARVGRRGRNQLQVGQGNVAASIAYWLTEWEMRR